MKKYRVKVESPLGTYTTISQKLSEDEYEEMRQFLQDCAEGKYTSGTFKLTSGEVTLGRDVLTSSAFSLIEDINEKV